MSLFSKRHYEAIAQVIASMDEANDVAASTFAKAFAADNSRFNRRTFLKACGFKETTINFLGEERS